MSSARLSVRWLGRVAYGDADALQRGLQQWSSDDHLLLLEHPHIYTLGTRGRTEHVLVRPVAVGAEIHRVDRGGDVTYHGPGQLVGYPVVTLPESRPGARDVVAYVHGLEDALIAALAELGAHAHRDPRYPGVWAGKDKIAAIGVKVTRGRTRHGFALNVDPDLSMFDHIVPCGIADRGVTSLSQLVSTAPTMHAVVDVVVRAFAREFGYADVDRQDVAWRISPPSPIGSQGNAPRGQRAHERSVTGEDSVPVRMRGRLAEAQAGLEGTIAPAPGTPRPPWMRVRARVGPVHRELRELVRELDLHTVCEEAGCPNIYECWGDRTATFMILGKQCTRACGFCQVDTRHPFEVDSAEPGRVADAVARLGLAHAVVTGVARDDLVDGGASTFAATIRAVRARTSGTRIEVLIPDCRGDRDALARIFEARPDVLNHNLETVARLHRAVRPSAGYARSLGLLARARSAGLITKSGMMLGLGETEAEVRSSITDLHGVGVEVLTLGQYLRPSADHLPVMRWWTPDEFNALGEHARALGFTHVESGPLVRSSYHAARAVDAVRSTGASTASDPGAVAG